MFPETFYIYEKVLPLYGFGSQAKDPPTYVMITYASINNWGCASFIRNISLAFWIFNAPLILIIRTYS
jgi:hypothetical protein